jgi:predicted nucleotidyltransferase
LTREKNRKQQEMDLSELIPQEEWQAYLPMLDKADEQGLRYCLGGGLAFSAYSHRRRNTKDVDLFIMQEELDRYLKLLQELGCTDYFETEPYARSWIYRADCKGVILDLIWALPNHRLRVEDDWFARGKKVTVHGRDVELIPVEELIRTKIYVLQSDRCDWPDLWNVLYQESENIDWESLLEKMNPDEALLGSLLTVFFWLRPEAAAKIPQFVWEKTGFCCPVGTPVREDRVMLLDTRHWFGPARVEKK